MHSHESHTNNSLWRPIFWGFKIQRFISYQGRLHWDAFWILLTQNQGMVLEESESPHSRFNFKKEKWQQSQEKCLSWKMLYKYTQEECDAHRNPMNSDIPMFETLIAAPVPNQISWPNHPQQQKTLNQLMVHWWVGARKLSFWDSLMIPGSLLNDTQIQIPKPPGPKLPINH